LHFIPGLAFFQMDYEFDFSAFQEVLFRFSPQFIEVRRFQKEAQDFCLFRQFGGGILLQKLAHQLVILPLGLSFHAGIQLRLKLNMDRLLVGYLTHP
jgi:hypothetical protein